MYHVAICTPHYDVRDCVVGYYGGRVQPYTYETVALALYIADRINAESDDGSYAVAYPVGASPFSRYGYRPFAATVAGDEMPF